MRLLVALMLCYSVSFTQEVYRAHIGDTLYVQINSNPAEIIIERDTSWVSDSAEIAEYWKAWGLAHATHDTVYSYSLDTVYQIPKSLVDLKFRTDSLLWKMYETYMGVNARTYFSESATEARVAQLRANGAVIFYMGTRNASGTTPIRGYRP